MYFDIDGNEISMAEHSKLFESPNDRFLLKTLIGATDVYVSTVWIGITHGEDADGKPLIFETCVFGNNDNEVTERYSSLDDAVVGHYRNVDKFFEFHMRAKKQLKVQPKALGDGIIDIEAESVG